MATHNAQPDDATMLHLEAQPRELYLARWGRWSRRRERVSHTRAWDPVR